MPSARFSHQATTSADVDEAWAALQRPDTWGQLAGVQDVSSPSHSAHGLLEQFLFVVAVAGQRYSGTATTVRHTPLEEMALNIRSSELEGTITVALAPIDASTELNVSLELAPKGLLSTMFFPAITQAIGGGLGRQVDDLAARMADL
jgi:carbon monoxide dehydrogenase subunit G